MLCAFYVYFIVPGLNAATAKKFPSLGWIKYFYILFSLSRQVSVSVERSGGRICCNWLMKWASVPHGWLQPASSRWTTRNCRTSWVWNNFLHLWLMDLLFICVCVSCPICSTLISGTMNFENETGLNGNFSWITHYCLEGQNSQILSWGWRKWWH